MTHGDMGGCFAVVCTAVIVAANWCYNLPLTMRPGYGTSPTPSESRAFESNEVKDQFFALLETVHQRKRYRPLEGRRKTADALFESIDDPAYSSKNLITRQEMENALANQQTIERIVLGR